MAQLIVQEVCICLKQLTVSWLLAAVGMCSKFCEQKNCWFELSRWGMVEDGGGMVGDGGGRWGMVGGWWGTVGDGVGRSWSMGLIRR